MFLKLKLLKFEFEFDWCSLNFVRVLLSWILFMLNLNLDCIKNGGFVFIFLV